MSAGPAVASEAAFDTALGDPDEWAREAVALDDSEHFPAARCAQLDELGLPATFVPQRWGGTVEDHELSLRLWRSVARRDLATAVAHGKTYLGAAPVWIAGTPEQARGAAGRILAGEPVAWALSEPEHGADLLAGSVTARPAEGGGHRLDGTKWPINNATRAGLLTVLARTGSAHGPRDQSLFLVDKTDLAPGTWRALPKVPTHGIRGIDISGIEFTGAAVPDGAMIGPEGSGIETVLRALQLTRTMCTALSLGAGEQGLRIGARFVAERVIQRRPLIDRPYPAAVLGRAAALLAAAEAAALVAARSLHALTGEMSVASAVVKAAVPDLVDAALSDLAELLGARSFLTGVYAHGAFQKLRRDHRIVAVFDGSTPVNRAALVLQFPRLAACQAAAEFDVEGLAEAVAPGTGLRPLDRDALTLFSRHGCSPVQSLPTLCAAIAAADGPAGLAEHAAGLAGAARRVRTLMSEVRPSARPPAASYELAAAYELCYVGAACLHLWATVGTSKAAEPLWADALWVRCALRAVRHRLADVLRTAAPGPVAGDDYLDARWSRAIADAALTGAPVTPFGIALPFPALLADEVLGRLR